MLSRAEAGVSLANVPTAAPSASPTPQFLSGNPPAALYVANPSLNTLSIIPPGSSGNASSLLGSTQLSNPYGIAYYSGDLYVTNAGTDTITIYSAAANGSVNPVNTISGSSTGLDDPVAIAIDSSGKIYVANRGSPSGGADTITVYAAGSSGNVTPTATITGTYSALILPRAIAVDSQGNIYVANEGIYACCGPPSSLGSIAIFAPDSNGDATPTSVISGPSTGIEGPGGIAVDSAGNIYVTSLGAAGGGSSAILIFSPGSNGDVAPATSIDENWAYATTPGGLALDSSGDIYVTNPGNDASGDESVVEYTNVSPQPQAAQALTPALNIFGSATGLDQPMGIALDPSGNMYVTNSQTDSVVVFSPGATGNVWPSATISSPNALDNPTAVALDPSGNIYVANDGDRDGSGDTITIYPAGSNAAVAPIETIGSDGPTDNTGLSDPIAIAVHPTCGLAVLNQTGGGGGSGTITFYPFNSSGNVTPSYTMPTTSSYYAMRTPAGIAFDPNRIFLWVANATGGPTGSGSIFGFLFNIYGNCVPGGAPVTVIEDSGSSPSTGLNSPAGIALDSSSNIYVTNDGSISGSADTVTEYAAYSNGDVAPKATISGSNTGLNMPQGIAVDSSGYIYVSNAGSENGGADTITVYPPSSNGNVAPSITVTGPLSGLSSPLGLAVGPGAWAN